MAIGWQSEDGNQMATRWPSGGNQMVIRWQSEDGNQMAIKWPSDGNRVAIRWPSGGRREGNQR